MCIQRYIIKLAALSLGSVFQLTLLSVTVRFVLKFYIYPFIYMYFL